MRVLGAINAGSFCVQRLVNWELVDYQPILAGKSFSGLQLVKDESVSSPFP
jgi:hypothetical protein